LEYSWVLKTRKLLIFRRAKNAQYYKIAPNWNVIWNEGFFSPRPIAWSFSKTKKDLNLEIDLNDRTQVAHRLRTVLQLDSNFIVTNPVNSTLTIKGAFNFYCALKFNTLFPIDKVSLTARGLCLDGGWKFCRFDYRCWTSIDFTQRCRASFIGLLIQRSTCLKPTGREAQFW
jgi:hypothetical protein